MKKSSMIFKMICLAVSIVLSLSVLPVMAEEAVEAEEVVTVENVEDVTEEAVVEDEAAAEEDIEEATEDEEVAEEATSAEEEEEVVEEEEEVLDLFTATLRDGGVYITPGDDNAAVFNYDGLRYRVLAGTGNLVKLEGFETGVSIENSIAQTEKNRLQANGEITTEAAHSGYFGLSVSQGEVVYRTAVSAGDVYAFSAWVKMPAGGSIEDDDRAFKVIGDSGDEYIVGWNEIGRAVTATGSWQQILFTFKAPETGLFQIDFNYKGRNALSLDDIELYDAELFLNPLEIRSIECTQGGRYQGRVEVPGTAFDPSEGFTEGGILRHKITVYNSDEDDVYFTAVMILYKDGKFDQLGYTHDYALVNDETEIEVGVMVNSSDAAGYSYVVYVFNDTDHTQIYGKVGIKENPYVVYGH